MVERGTPAAAPALVVEPGTPAAARAPLVEPVAAPAGGRVAPGGLRGGPPATGRQVVAGAAAASRALSAAGAAEARARGVGPVPIVRPCSWMGESSPGLEKVWRRSRSPT